MKKTKDYPKESQCRYGLHDWRTTQNDGHTYREDCKKCSEHAIWPVGIGGKDRKWLRFHARDTLQPWGNSKGMFIQEYGIECYEKIIERTDNEKENWGDIVSEAKEDLKLSRKKHFV